MPSPNITSYVPSWFSVYDFNAIGTGNLDDAAAIQTTMVHASQNGGGFVLITAGTFRLDQSLSWAGLTNVCVWVGVGAVFTGVGTLPNATGLNNSIFNTANSGVGAVYASLPLDTDGLANPTIRLPAANAITQTNTVTGTALIASGLTGSQSATRYVGGTVSVAPTAGAHLVGDWCVSQDGKLFICTVAGTPGTWATLSATAGSPVTAVTGTDPITSTGGTTPVINWNAAYAINQTNTVTGTALIASGLTGSQAATRYVGGTVSVAPTTGTYVVGDHVTAQNGTMWVCTVAGTPGTWVQVGTVGNTTASTLIERKTLTTTTTTIVFSAIPQTYTNLRLVADIWWTGATGLITTIFNGTSGNHTYWRTLQVCPNPGVGLTTTTLSYSYSAQLNTNWALGQSGWCHWEGLVYGYADTTHRHRYSNHNHSLSTFNDAYNGLINGYEDRTTAITSWEFTASVLLAFSAGTSIALYGET